MTTPAQREAVARVVAECHPAQGVRMSVGEWQAVIVDEIIAAYEAAAPKWCHSTETSDDGPLHAPPSEPA